MFFFTKVSIIAVINSLVLCNRRRKKKEGGGGRGRNQDKKEKQLLPTEWHKTVSFAVNSEFEEVSQLIVPRGKKNPSYPLIPTPKIGGTIETMKNIVLNIYVKDLNHSWLPLKARRNNSF